MTSREETTIVVSDVIAGGVDGEDQETCDVVSHHVYVLPVEITGASLGSEYTFPDFASLVYCRRERGVTIAIALVPTSMFATPRVPNISVCDVPPGLMVASVGTEVSSKSDAAITLPALVATITVIFPAVVAAYMSNPWRPNAPTMYRLLMSVVIRIGQVTELPL